jgi:hypothetical protein
LRDVETSGGPSDVFLVGNHHKITKMSKLHRSPP